MADPNQLNSYINLWFGVLTRLLGFLGLIFANRGQMSKPSLGVSILRSINNFLRICFPGLDIEVALLNLKTHFGRCCHGDDRALKATEAPAECEMARGVNNARCGPKAEKKVNKAPSSAVPESKAIASPFAIHKEYVRAFSLDQPPVPVLRGIH